MSTAQPPTSTRPNTALIVIDVQNGVMQAAWNSEGVISTISDLVDRARNTGTGTEVIWVRHSSGELPIDSPQWQIVDALSPADGEAIVEKTHGNTFEDTDFEEVLAAATTSPSSPTPTPRRTSPNGALPHRSRSSPTRTCTGSSNPVPVGRQGCRNRARSTSPNPEPRTPNPGP
ncbi:isochorismatase family protein [Brevibacterium sp. CFH 10365]|uniref:isochorismatase family protein n=1 Tax=Brevibacterium sp. CFH 10365 TaxID=2585207 RepID=UPI0029D4169B|nr:isochorismatase family protein [Brevibacterium sp. CFH 10365]